MASGKRKVSEPEGESSARGGAPIDLEVGQTLAGKYRIERLLGRGGMGTVWLCTHLGLGERVAVKVLSGAIANNPEVRARFEREARASAKIKSRYVARVYDADHLDDGRPFLVMEHMEGETLAHSLKTSGPLALADAVRILRQVGRGLARAHELGIVHRDVKPDNVFLAHTADDGAIAKVFDFGIVKVADALAVEDATQEGALLGTPQYMSPEQVEGLATIDARSDIYSLGVVAYRMLSGKRLFSGESLSTVLMQICSAPLPKLTESVPGLPAGMDDWFRRTCARDREERYPTALACVEALAIAAGEMDAPEITVPPPAIGSSSLIDVVAPAPRRPTMSGGGAPGEPPSLTPGGAFQQPLPEEAAPRRARTRAAILVGAAVCLALGVAIMKPTSSGESNGRSEPLGSASTASASAAPVASTPPTSSAVDASVASVPAVAPASDAPDSAPRAVPARPRRRDAPRSSPATKSTASDDRINDVGY